MVVGRNRRPPAGAVEHGQLAHQPGEFDIRRQRRHAGGEHQRGQGRVSHVQLPQVGQQHGVGRVAGRAAGGHRRRQPLPLAADAVEGRLQDVPGQHRPGVARQQRRDVARVGLGRGVGQPGLLQPHQRQHLEPGLVLAGQQQPQVGDPHPHRLRVDPGVLVLQLLGVQAEAGVRVRGVRLGRVRPPQVEDRQGQIHRQRLPRREQPLQVEDGQQAVFRHGHAGAVAEAGPQGGDDQPGVGQGVGVDGHRPQPPGVMHRPVDGSAAGPGGEPGRRLEVVRLEEHALVPVDRPRRHSLLRLLGGREYTPTGRSPATGTGEPGRIFPGDGSRKASKGLFCRRGRHLPWPRAVGSSAARCQAACNPAGPSRLKFRFSACPWPYRWPSRTKMVKFRSPPTRVR